MVQENRTFVCSVLFLDIVAYSKHCVADQLRLKQRFNELLGEALRNVAVNGRIVLDTGDGAAVSFPGNPEDALFVAIELRDKLALDDPTEFEVRFGINLGPVRMITDINQHTNIIGNGINVAERIMSFADPGQILVSRSYYEVIACLSSDYEQLFEYEGARTDKHVHEHEVYLVGKTNPDQPLASLIQASTPPPVNGMALRDSARQAWERLQATLPRRFKGRVPALLSLALVLVVSGGIAVRAALHQDGPAPAATADTAQTGAFATQRGEASLPNGETSLPTGEVSLPNGEASLNTGEASLNTGEASFNAGEASTSAGGRASAAPETGSPQAPLAVADAGGNSTAPARAGTASVRITIAPWGEAYVDGNKRGVCSPICEFDVAAGTRRIEVRNPSADPRQEIVSLDAGEQRALSYRF